MATEIDNLSGGTSLSSSRIRNCPWGYKCDKTWDLLIATDSEEIRFCDTCDRAVYLCRTKQELADSVLLNRCVSFPPSLLHSRNREKELDSDFHITPDLGGMVIGEVAPGYDTSQYELEEVTGRFRFKSSPENSADFMYFANNGGLYMETEYDLSEDRMKVTWIEKEYLPKFLDTLGLRLDSAASKKDMEKVLRKVLNQFDSLANVKSWLSKHKIKSRYGSWSGSGLG